MIEVMEGKEKKRTGWSNVKRERRRRPRRKKQQWQSTGEQHSTATWNKHYQISPRMTGDEGTDKWARTRENGEGQEGAAGSIAIAITTNCPVIAMEYLDFAPAGPTNECTLRKGIWTRGGDGLMVDGVDGPDAVVPRTFCIESTKLIR